MVTKLLELKPLAHLGRRSYGFYLWHLPFAWWVMPLEGPQQLFWAFALTFAMAEFSYKYVEQPALVWGRKLEALAKQHRRESRATSSEIPAALPA
jgi:peptidoglycan/LPS O-acetylase OafA/YrhL